MKSIKKLFYDTETTGLDPKKSSIIQLSGVMEINGRIVEEFDFKLRPHPKAVIEPEALTVNGKTMDEIMAYNLFEVGHKDFVSLLDRHIDRFDKRDKAYLVGYNNRKFDDEFLRMLFTLSGDNYFGSWFWPDSLDVMVLASQYLIGRRPFMPSFQLERVAIELGIIPKKSSLHDSKYDSQLTREIYQIVTGLEVE